MVSLQTVQQSNARLPQGLVALFIGATSGIGQSTLRHFAQNVSAPRIYSVARPVTVPAHEKELASLRQAHPDGTFNLIEADASLVSDMDKVAALVKSKETKLDVLFMSAGFMPFEGNRDKVTKEGLEPSMSTRYYSRIRALQQVLPLLHNAPSPRVVSVLAGGLESAINEADLDLREPGAWSVWGSSVQSSTMQTLALEVLAQENPKLRVVHWFPGPVNTPALARAEKFGMASPGGAAMSYDESGARGLFLATSPRYEAGGEGQSTAGGIYLVNPQCDTANSERVLVDMRQRGVDRAVWNFTQKIFDDAVAGRQPAAAGSKDEL